MLAKEKINELKQSVNIVDIIGESVALTKAGRNYIGLCPFHGEKTPSFNVVEDKQFYHCFGCGKSGDVFKLLRSFVAFPLLMPWQLLLKKLVFKLNSSPLISRRNQDSIPTRFF